MKKITMILAAGILLSGCGNSGSDDQKFVGFVSQQIPNVTSERLIKTGHTICEYLEAKPQPANKSDVIQELTNLQKAGLTSTQSEIILGASISAYCTKFRNIAD